MAGRTLRALAGMLALAASLLFSNVTAQAAFPGENGRIAYHGFFSFHGHLASANPDTSDSRPISGTTGAWEESPSWSADGKRLTFTRFNESRSEFDIWVIDADGGNQTRVTTGARDGNPVFTPDGTRIVFDREAGDWDLMIVNVDGTDLRSLTDTPEAQELEPTVSPDGQWVAFADDGIRKMPLAGGPSVEVANAHASNPDYSPDGSLIAVEGCANAVIDRYPCGIYTVSASGGPLSPVPVVTDNPEESPMLPAFSPDGTRIAAEMWEPRTYGHGIVTVPVTGGPVQSRFSVGDYEPSWQPRPTNPDESQPGATDPGKCRGLPVTVRGTTGADKIVGTAGDDVINALGGADRIKGKKGSDIVCGSNGR